MRISKRKVVFMFLNLIIITIIFSIIYVPALSVKLAKLKDIEAEDVVEIYGNRLGYWALIYCWDIDDNEDIVIQDMEIDNIDKVTIG